MTQFPVLKGSKRHQVAVWLRQMAKAVMEDKIVFGSLDTERKTYEQPGALHPHPSLVTHGPFVLTITMMEVLHVKKPQKKARR